MQFIPAVTRVPVGDLAMSENLPDGSAQVKVWQADQLIDAAAQTYSVTATPGALTVQLSVVPRRRRI